MVSSKRWLQNWVANFRGAEVQIYYRKEVSGSSILSGQNRPRPFTPPKLLSSYISGNTFFNQYLFLINFVNFQRVNEIW